jgi:hypothetical protein
MNGKTQYGAKCKGFFKYEHVKGNKQNRSMCNMKATPISCHREKLSIYETNHKNKT